MGNSAKRGSKMSRQTVVNVHIVLDTNCLYTDAADKLIREELSSFILKSLDGEEVNVVWHLPEIVRAERQHQMMRKAQHLLPHLAKVESLLGHAFGITSETLEERVVAAIAREIERHKLVLHDLDVAKVNWVDVILRAVQRRPPFEPGEKEKGFRDAIVLETFLQLIDGLPKSPQNCRIIMMSGDQLLTDVARERTTERNNVFFTGNIEDVQTLLNTLASTLTQEMVEKILPIASDKFFKRGDETTIYYRDRVYDRIVADSPEQLNSLPDSEYTSSAIRSIKIGVPTFLEKKRQRLRFSSRVIFEVEATKVVRRPPPLHAGLPAGSGIFNTGSPLGSLAAPMSFVGPSASSGSNLTIESGRGFPRMARCANLRYAHRDQLHRRF
jgi:hypothetical protein